MEYKIIDLNDEQVEDIEFRLDEYDDKHIKYKMSGKISIGILSNDTLIAGVDACITTYKILYVSTLFVDEKYRGKGIGKKLMENLEKRAISMGVNMIRLDTFDWQGAEFYRSLGYEQVGGYSNEIDDFSEYFFMKKLYSKYGG